jgi:hypothetical protein
MMNAKEREYVEEVYRDCVELERVGDLTEFGAGQGALCCVLLGKELRRSFRIKTGKEIRCRCCLGRYEVGDDDTCVFCGSRDLEIGRIEK